MGRVHNGESRIALAPEFSARSRFTNRKFPFVCSGSVNQFFIDVHFCMTSKGQMMLDIQFWVHFACVIKVSPGKNGKEIVCLDPPT